MKKASIVAQLKPSNRRGPGLIFKMFITVG